MNRTRDVPVDRPLLRNGGRMMRAAYGLGLAVVLTVPVTGCGGASSPHRSAGAKASASVSDSVRAALQQRASTSAKFAGEQTPAPTIESADAFISGDPNKTDAAAFRSEGLRAAAISHPTVPGADGAIRLVLVFPDARTAQADAQRNVRSAPPGSTAKTFSVPGVPGGQGNELDTPDGHIGGMNEFFTVGAYEYIVGVAPTAGAASAPSRDAMNAVVVAWYHQVAALT